VVFQVQQRHTSAKDTKCLGCPITRKPDKNVDQVKGLVFKNRRTTIHETCQEFHMGHFRAFWKIIRTCITLPSNLCTAMTTLLWLYVYFWVKNDCQSTPSLLTRFSTIQPFLFPELKMAIKGRKLVSPWFQQSWGTHLPSFKKLLPFYLIRSLVK
jgi:hypothetical protein